VVLKEIYSETFSHLEQSVRVGIEDNVWYNDLKTRLASNRDLVQRVLSIAGAMGCERYSQQKTRELLGI
jgi:uncharacterized protein (DUF849 family)